MQTPGWLAAPLAVLVVLASCSTATGPSVGPSNDVAVNASPDAPSPTSRSPAADSQPRAPVASASPEDGLAGTVVRFTGDDATVDVTLVSDNATSRDFVSLLPLTLALEEFNGREKIGDPPRRLETSGSPGSDPADGDLIYFVPWGNLGFYYDASGIGYSEQTIHLGTFDATREQLDRLEGEISVDLVD